MDNFGFQTQGKLYHKFRPKYPECMYNFTIDKIQKRNRYLDIAMGTGQLLFRIAPAFDSSKGIDISEKMLDTAKAILESDYVNLKHKVTIEKCDVMSLPTNQKYDLITIGQALHWFPVRESLKNIKSIMQPEGKLLVLSYVLKKIENEQDQKQHQQFYSKVKPFFDFDRDELHNHYINQEKYPFEELFPSVVRFSEQVKIPMTKSGYVSYLKTYSGYNQYLKQKPDSPDPIKEIEQGKNEEITLVFDYFKIQCGFL